MKKHTGTFKTHSDDGKIFTIHEYTNFIKSGSFEDPDQLTAGMKELRTSDGKTVNRIEKGKYKILDVFGNVTVYSNMPDAP